MASTTAAPPAALVIFGASGDLAARKLIPALHVLNEQGSLDGATRLVGVGRSDLGDDGWRQALIDAGGPAEGPWRELLEGAAWVAGDYTDPGTYERLDELLGEFPNRLFYLSVPPSLFGTIADHLGRQGLQEDGDGYARLVIEKPFGHDLESSRELDRALHAVFREDQLFRIDHFLAKDTVLNVMAMRFSNSIFEPLWNRRYVESVQITIAESLGIGHRAGFYDAAGALRDIVQNHALQVLALVAMEPPVSMDAHGIRDNKVALLSAVDVLQPEEVDDNVVRARYSAGTVDGQEVPGYLEEEDVPDDSTTETYVAMRLRVDNWRWSGVPFFVRTGKRLPARATEVALRFRPVPHLPFASTQTAALEQNELVMRIQPDEGITLSFGAKVPGLENFEVRTVDMEMTWCEEFGVEPPDAYERVLHDALLGDATLFIRSDEVDRSWRIVQPVLDAWAAGACSLQDYEAGTWGPTGAADLVDGSGGWHCPT